MARHISSFKLSNWRGLSDISISELYPAQAFIGANGTGKTSLIWSLITFISAINCRLNYEPNHFSSNELFIYGNEMSKSLCEGHLKSEKQMLSSFIPAHLQGSKDEKTESQLSGVVGDVEYKCCMKPNGVIKLIPPLSNQLHEKIRFAFFTGNPVVGVDEQEQFSMGDVISTSSYCSFRRMYSRLNATNKKEFDEHLHKLFGIKGIVAKLTEKDPGNCLLTLLIQEEDGGEVELIQTGTAFRKAFISLCMMYYLSQLVETRCIFFIEEIEAFLHPSMQIALMRIILNIAEHNNIQLFLTSCSTHVLKQFDQTKCFMMTKEKTIIREPWTDNLITLDLLGINPQSIIIMCDGDQDTKFLSKLITLMGLPSDTLDIIKFYPNSSNHQSAIGLLKKHFPKVYIIVIQDREFSQEPFELICNERAKELGVNSENVFIWELPCIESYLVSHYFLEIDHSILDWLVLKEESDLWVKYSKCYMGGVKATKSVLAYLKPIWSQAEAAVQKIHNKEPITSGDIFAIVKALKGHELEKDIKNLSKKQIGRDHMLHALTANIVTYPGIAKLKALLLKAYKDVKTDK